MVSSECTQQLPAQPSSEYISGSQRRIPSLNFEFRKQAAKYETSHHYWCHPYYRGHCRICHGRYFVYSSEKGSRHGASAAFAQRNRYPAISPILSTLALVAGVGLVIVGSRSR